ncbi:MAG TPA: endonuclease III domain-containing protein [Thermoanaerobaculia bacterium]|nr:endonuclease III domain-containing protein [Thermoanaerobaculia bacterium]
MESHGWYRLAPFRWSVEERVLRRSEALPGGIVELEIAFRRNKLVVQRSGGLQPAGRLKLSATSENDDGDELRKRITRMFQLDLDMREFHELASASPDHAWVVEARFGRLLCGSTLWEDAVKVITTTNTMWRQTVRMCELLVAKCGRDGAFPSQEDVARFTEEELQRDCRLGYRAKTIRALADFRFGELPEGTQDRYKYYLQLPGIGPYGAAHLLAMDGRHDFIAVDTEFRRHVRERYHRGRTVSDAAMLRRYRKWGRWKYLAYWSELWRDG